MQMQREQVQTNEAQAGGAERLGTGTAARLVALCALIAATLAFVVPSAVAQVDTSGDGQGRVVNGTVVVAGADCSRWWGSTLVKMPTSATIIAISSFMILPFTGSPSRDDRHEPSSIT